MKKSFLLLLIAVSGCALPSKEVLETADYGEPIAQEDAQKIADAYLVRQLKDPESRRVTFYALEKGYCKPDGMFSDWVYGYKMRTAVNAKNSFGGYTGKKFLDFFFINGKLLKVFPAAGN